MKTFLPCWAVFALFLLGAHAQSTPKPNFNGTWKLMRVSRPESSQQVPNEVYTFTQKGHDFHAKMHIQDELGDRTFLVEAKMDGKPSDQKCAATPCTITAQWEDHSLV